MKRLTRRFIVRSLDSLSISEPIRYERYYINDNLRIQKKNALYEKEVLNEDNIVTEKIEISETEFLKLKMGATSEIVRDSYLYLKDNRVSIKKYYGLYKELYRVEVTFSSAEEMNDYQKEDWMLEEITNSPLAFDKYLRNLSREDFKKELEKYIDVWNDYE